MPDLGALYLLLRAVGLQRAKELIFSTREIEVQKAMRLGIEMDVHESEALEGRALQKAESLTHTSPTALALTTAALNARLNPTNKPCSAWRQTASQQRLLRRNHE
ncbi:enoyl-CoA hydratase/isomerase family protein [Hydrogenophaga sp.]|uniref:enoyl-CoA hydratase/isomerase family protein n=1 Tax=Hydrogenophaga sp. TaxID=1904254 RepID=UPI002721434B|nr:enoyl-CoA hydratase-related protein [Hydrogenophaga sp.]MDO9504299.1 enoyl-CoA hydratase-related protein [Hydrogenophaga sp.]